MSDAYPQWKIDTLEWMQSNYDADSNEFTATFMKDLKVWTGEKFAGDKKQIKFAMQFASFQKNEVNEVGAAALETQMPFDQMAIMQSNLTYIRSQLQIPDLDVIKAEETPDLPDRISEQVTPGKPYLWLR